MNELANITKINETKIWQKKRLLRSAGSHERVNSRRNKESIPEKAIQYHPDKNPGDKEAEEKFKEAAEAYDVLSNPDKRARYDQFGHAGMSGAAGNGGPFGGFSGGMSMDDIFSMFGDILAAIAAADSVVVSEALADLEAEVLNRENSVARTSE